MNKKLRLKENNFNEIIEVFRHASSIASVAINEIYNTKFITELKSDNTPVTKADVESHKIIVNILKEFS